MNDDFTAGQAKFIDQYTRKLMVQWCHETLQMNRSLVARPGGLQAPAFGLDRDNVYVQYAISKKWVSAKDDKILSAGWATAAAFLKR